MMKRKKVIWVSAMIVITALIIVLCVSIFTKEQISEYDGTLVKTQLEFPALI